MTSENDQVAAKIGGKQYAGYLHDLNQVIDVYAGSVMGYGEAGRQEQGGDQEKGRPRH